MANLSVENISNVMQLGVSPENPKIQEGNLLKEMGNQGIRPTSPAEGEKSFSEILKDSVDQVNTYQHQSDAAIGELVAGRSKNIHETLLTIERADTSLKLMMQVRNKILDAYKEIMRMQV